MDRPRVWGDRRFLLGSASLGVVLLGIVISAWALANIVVGPAPVTGPAPYVPKSEPVRSSSTPTGSAEATSAAAPRQATTYALDPATGDILGTLTIPALDQSFPVIEGTGTEELKRGVGHLVQTALPGEPDNCVISGHRDTVFSRLGSLEIGDVFVIETATGTYTYKISRIRIVHKDDRTVVVPTDHAVLSVSTCYPFQFVGSAPDRYVLIADLVDSE
ncbi:MAG: class D sortase [Coriobacteriia bacterium]|nr:class D sortase [Coriobacteriia bacterium]